jgi:hypothetical protein
VSSVQPCVAKQQQMNVTAVLGFTWVSSGEAPYPPSVLVGALDLFKLGLEPQR